MIRAGTNCNPRGMRYDDELGMCEVMTLTMEAANKPTVMEN